MDEDTPLVRATLGGSVKSVYLYAHTVSRMSWRQVVGVAERKTRELLVPRIPIDFDRRYEERVPAEVSPRFDPFAENATMLSDCLDADTRRRYRKRAREAADGRPSFLNRRLRIADGESVDWYDERLDDLPRLWRLKLYSFQPLSAAVLGYGVGEHSPTDCRRQFDAWLRDWMRTVDIGSPAYLRNAWTPYAVSLRIQHWIRYLSWRRRVSDRGSAGADDLERAVAREIFKNALFLSAHIERDVGGNHLIENGAALVAAGLFFPRHGREFLDTGVSILAEAVADQFLDDGCHYERSPMYHVLCLTRLLTARDLLDRTGEPIPDAVRRTTAAATGFLRSLTPPDRRIPLLNDAVYGEALPLDACLRYADAVDVTAPSPRGRDPAPAGRDTGGSGYRWLRTDHGAMLVDGGSVGPPHLPGHAHSDTLSVLLWLEGAPILTDTGTFSYEAGERRDYARGVRGHNTVQVGETEPIALGGRFLMGPRPDPDTRFEPGDVSLFEGRYEATPFDGDAYTHHRSVYAGDRWWVVQDTVRGGEGAGACGRLHVHPDVHLRSTSSDSVGLDTDDGPVGSIRSLGETRIGTGQSRYFPRFGVSMNRPVLHLSPARDERRLATIRFLVCPTGIGGDADVETDGPVPTAITVVGDRYRLPRARLFPR